MYWNLFDIKNHNKGANDITDTLDLYNFAESRDISVDDFNKINLKSLVVELSPGEYAIAINEKNLTNAQKKVCLAHELGHCETGSFYNVNNPLDLICKHEARATRWSIKELVSKDELHEAVMNGYTQLWELAEHFDLPQDFMQKIVCYYEGIE